MRRFLLALLGGLALVMAGGIVATADTSPTPPNAPLPSASLAPVPPPPAPGAKCDARQNVEQGGAGINALIALPCVRGNNDPTLFEKYPASAYSSFHTASPVDTNVFNDFANAIASFLFSWIVTIGTVCAATLEWTFSLEMAGGINTQLNANGVLGTVVEALGSHIYRPFFVTAVLITGIWVTWNGLLRRRMSLTMETAGWVVLATSVASFFLAAPTWAVGSLDSLSLGASQLILGTVAQADPDISNSSYATIYNKDPNVRQYAGLRAAVNRYWQIYVFKTWEVGEFGSTDMAERKAPNGLTYAEWELQANASGDSAAQQQVAAAVEGQLDPSHDRSLQPFKDWHDGGQGSQRLALAGITLITIIIATVLLIFVAGTIILAQLALVLLTMLAPLFFLIGIYPSTGRRIFLRWGELVLGFLLRRVLYSAFLAVVMVLGGMIMATVANQSWFLAAALQLALVIAALMYRKPLAAVFGQVGVGGLQPLLAPYRDRAERAAKSGAGRATSLWDRLAVLKSTIQPVKLKSSALGGERADRGSAEGPRPGVFQSALKAANGAAALAAGEVGVAAGAAATKAVAKTAGKKWPRSNQGGSLPQEDVDARAEQRRLALRDIAARSQASDDQASVINQERERRRWRVRERFDRRLRDSRPKPLLPEGRDDP
jgi:hypothetical protein